MICCRILKTILWFFILIFSFSPAGHSQTPTLSSSFRINHTSNARFFVTRKYIHTRDKGTVITGKWGTTEDGADLLIIKLNDRGQVLWSKTAAVGIRLDEYELTEMSDGSIVFIGNSIHNTAPTNSDMLLIKFTCKGDIMWSRNLSMNASVRKRFLTPYSIKEGKKNDAIISFYSSEINWQYTVFCRVNSSGDLVWSKTFYGTDPQTNLPSVSFFSEEKIVVFVFKSLYLNTFNYNKSFIAMKLSYDNGAFEEAKEYNYSEFITNSGVLVAHPKIHFYAEHLMDGNFALYGEFSNFSRQTAYYYKLIIGKDLAIKQSNTFSTPFDLGKGYSKISVFPNGQTHIVSAVYDRSKFYWYAADRLNNKIREKAIEYPSAYLHLQYMAAQSGINRSTYIVSSMVDLKSSIQVIQVEDGDSRIDQCLGMDTSFIKELPWQVSTSTARWDVTKDNEATLTPLQFITADISVTSEYICEPVKTQGPEKSQLKIIGEDTVCFAGSSHHYITRTLDKSTTVQWELDANQNGSLTKLNDSTVSIFFKKPVGKPEHFKLYASAVSCEVLKDSIFITVFPEKNKLSDNLNSCDLPASLQPGSWFKNYLWQDGSTDSFYIATKPGKYSVKMQSYCGDFFADSIVISKSNTGTHNKFSVCKNDSVTLSAPPGFTKYEWTPAYHLIKLSDNRVRVYPERDTFYILTSTTPQGCDLKDTFFVKVDERRIINLGKDTFLCFNEEIALQVGSGFSDYSWNTGQSTQKILVNTPGIYHVSAHYASGCLAKDTILIQKKECKNSIHFPNAFTPNGDGNNDSFKPKVFGMIEVYELAVYNRWGEVVFKTNQVSSGWSGMYKGINQKTDTFVWVCTYKFLNEASKMMKGTVVMIQ